MLLVVLASCTRTAPICEIRAPSAPSNASPTDAAVVADKVSADEAGSFESLDAVDAAVARLRQRAVSAGPRTERSRVVPRAVRVRDLAHVHLPRADMDEEPGQSPADAPIAWADLRIDRAHNVVSGLWVGWAGHVFGDYLAAIGHCAPTPSRWRSWPVRFESLVVGADGQATYSVGDGALAWSSCRAGINRLLTAPASQLEPEGAIFGYVDPEGDEGPALVILFPATRHAVATGRGAAAALGAIGHARLPLRRGSGSAVLAEIERAHALEWLAETRQDAARGRLLSRERALRLRIGVDVVWPMDRADADVIAYATWISAAGRVLE